MSIKKLIAILLIGGLPIGGGSATVYGSLKYTVLPQPLVLGEGVARYSDGIEDYTVVGEGKAFDLNGDGINDVFIGGSPNMLTVQHEGDVYSALGYNGSQVVSAALNSVLTAAIALPAGTLIGPSSTFTTQPVLVDSTRQRSPLTGDDTWFDGNEHYLGLKIVSNGATYYGWLGMRLEVSPLPPDVPVAISHFQINGQPVYDDPLKSWEAGAAAVVSDWAIETSPDTPVPAGAVPEPTTATLMLCASMVCALGRHRQTILRR